MISHTSAQLPQSTQYTVQWQPSEEKQRQQLECFFFFRIHMLDALYSTRFEEMARKSRSQLFYRTFALSVVCDSNNGRGKLKGDMGKTPKK